MIRNFQQFCLVSLRKCSIFHSTLTDTYLKTIFKSDYYVKNNYSEKWDDNDCVVEPHIALWIIFCHKSDIPREISPTQKSGMIYVSAPKFFALIVFVGLFVYHLNYELVV